MNERTSGKKTMFHVGRRQHAGIFFTKPYVAPAGKEAVHPVADPWRNQAEHAKYFPQTSHGVQDLQHGGRHPEGAVASYIYQRSQGVVRVAETPQQVLAGFRLEGGKLEPCLPVMADQEPDKAVAEVADPVEKNDMGPRFYHETVAKISL